MNAISNTAPRFIIIVVHGVLLGCFAILFLICCYSAAAAAAVVCLTCESAHQRALADDGRSRLHGRWISTLHFIWAGCLLGLTIIGFLDLIWRGEFLGGDLLWTSALFLATSIVYSSNHTAHVSTKFVLNVVCIGIAVEKMCASIHLIYEYAAYRTYQVNMDRRTYIGQLVLICITTAVYGAGLLTALWGAVVYGKESVLARKINYKHSGGIHLFFSLGTLFYGIVITGCYVVFELGKWRYEQVPIEYPFFRLGNGPYALCVFIVQMVCLSDWRLLTVSAMLHVILAALALFTISPAISNTYYFANLVSAREALAMSTEMNTIWIVAVILAAGAALACVIAVATSVIQAARSTYILHHKSASTSSTVAPLEEHFESIRHSTPLGGATATADVYGASRHMYGHYAPSYVNHGIQTTPHHAHPIHHPHMAAMQMGHSPMHVQPMEEQSVYWSADENPFYYHTSKRYYGQPYQIESGYYGYQTSGTSGGQDGNLHRRVASSSAQTNIGHVFD